jgi:hypothetical protein
MRDQHPQRQGDILLVPIDELPKGLKEVPRDEGGIVLAEGEATGHFHRIEAPEEALLARDLGEIAGRFLVVNGEGAQAIDAWKCHNSRGEVCWVPADTPKESVEAASLTIVGRESVTGVALRHDEHLAFVIPPGTHEVRRQREYQEAGGVSYVAD